MVMKAMRAGTKPVIWIVSAAFVGTIIFAWGMNFTSRPAARGIIGEVDGTELALEEYSFRYQNAVQQRQQQAGEVTDEYAEQLRSEVFNQMVASVLLQTVVDEKNLELTNTEIAEHLRRFPPAEVQGIPDFQTDGRFDFSKYLAAYNSPDPQFWLQVEALMRPRILQQKIFEYVTATARVSDAEVRELYEAANERVRVRYLFAPASRYQDSIPEIDAAAIKAYYDEHPDEFRHLERAQLRLVSFPKNPSPDDSLEIAREMESLVERIRAGEDFAELARQYSEDATANTGGSLGWFGRGAMVPEFDSVAFALDSGAVSDPFLTQYGYHIVKSFGKRGKGDSLQVNASHILMRIQITAATQSDLRLAAEQFALDAREDGFDSAAVAQALSIASTGWFEKGQSIRVIGQSMAINEFAFAAKVGTISDPFDTPRNFIVALVEKREPAGVPPLAEVENRIRGILTSNARADAAVAGLAPAYVRIAAGESLIDVAADFGQPADSTAPFGRFDRVSQFGDDPVFRGVAFSLTKEKPLSKVTRLKSGAVIMELIERIPADAQLYAEKRDSIMTVTLDGKRSLVYNNWFSELRKHAEVHDYRYQLPGSY